MRVCFECQRCYDDHEDYCVEETHPALSPAREGSPEIIPGYQLDLLLETDVKGETYYAHHIASGGSCLIKIISADEKQCELFLSEASVAAGFFHPNVVNVYEAGYLESGEVFVVSEDAEGNSLRELLERENIPKVLTTVQVIRQTAEALHALHLNGLTHGMISPDNIILTSDAQHRLLARVEDIDFGGVVEKAVTSNKFLTESALVPLRYFAPEQCSGKGASTQTDIYSLGIVLHEMLAGSPPFMATKAVGLMEQHRNQLPPEIRIDDFDLRMLLTYTLTEALRKQPGTRQPSANAFARQMRHMEQLSTHTSVPPPAGIVPPMPRRAAVFTAGTSPAKLTVRQPAKITEPAPETREENITADPISFEPGTVVIGTSKVSP
jgi:serine/threonine-protein kinase